MLASVLPVEAFGFLLVLMRMVAIIMVMPALGDASIPSRIRILFALVFTLIVFFSVRQTLPAVPLSVSGLFVVLISEFFIGILFGLVVRLMLSAAHVAGTMIAMQTALGAAQSFDPSQGTQSALVSSFLTVTAITMLFVTDLHHLMIAGMAQSYTKFPVGAGVSAADFASIVTYYVTHAFAIGVQLAAPFIVWGLIYNLSLGLASRLIQGLQVFFIGMPINLFVGFFLLSILIGVMMRTYMTYIEDFLLLFVG